MYTAAQGEVRNTIEDERKKFTENERMLKLMDADAQVRQFIAMNEEEYIQKFSKVISDELAKQAKELVARTTSE